VPPPVPSLQSQGPIYTPQTIPNQRQSSGVPSPSASVCDHTCAFARLACTLNREIMLGIASHKWTQQETEAHIQACIDKTVAAMDRQ
jgi:hypothetical protein